MTWLQRYRFRHFFGNAICPLTYFDDQSRQRIEQIWDRSRWQYKDHFPLICNGHYADKAR